MLDTTFFIHMRGLFFELLLDRRGKRKEERFGAIREDVHKPPFANLGRSQAIPLVRVRDEFLARADPAEANGALSSQRRQRYPL